MSKVIVFKCGGSSIDDLSNSFFENIRSLKEAGIQPIIVHGGGPAIQDMLDKLEIESEFVDGLRKTTEEMMDIVEMVLVGMVNPALTRRVNAFGLQSTGLSGSDLQLLTASPINEEKYGLVGHVTKVNTDRLHEMLDVGVIPIISPIAISEDGKRYNVNADTVAGTIASAMKASQLVFVTDVAGILKYGQLLQEVTVSEVNTLMENGTIYGGMIPKVKAALESISSNVKEVKIVNGKKSELENKTTLKGTSITLDEKVFVSNEL